MTTLSQANLKNPSDNRKMPANGAPTAPRTLVIANFKPDPPARPRDIS